MTPFLPLIAAWAKRVACATLLETKKKRQMITNKARAQRAETVLQAYANPPWAALMAIYLRTMPRKERARTKSVIYITDSTPSKVLTIKTSGRLK